VIQVEQLKKTFGKVQAVKDVSFTVNPGEIVGLLGPNGAGKTTCMRIISGLVLPSSGRVTVGGLDVIKDVQTVQQSLGVMPDGGGLYSRLTARENIAYFGKLHKISPPALKQRINELVERLHMQDIIDRPTQGFSHGEHTKVALARATIHNPDYILLDEPTNGLDVLTTKAVRQLLLQLKQEGRAIIFSSHLMHEVNHLCERAIIIAKGQVAASGSLDELLKLTGTTHFEDAFVKLAYDNAG
jgi:sodium transport system ATP-binding protein